MNELELLKSLLKDKDISRWVYADWLEDNNRLEEANEQRSLGKYRREIKMTPAWDRMTEGHGQHGVNLTFYVIGSKGAVQFLIYTNWILSENPNDIMPRVSRNNLSPMPADIGYHSKVPMWEGQEMMRDDCELTGGPCYYDGSSLQAIRIFDQILLPKGSEEVWEYLEEYYEEIFERKE